MEEKRKRRFPATFSPYTNAEAVVRDTALIVAGVINARPAVPRNTWKWVKCIQSENTNKTIVIDSLNNYE